MTAGTAAPARLTPNVKLQAAAGAGVVRVTGER
jgi:hypothetical protein